jgi:AraC-like DNA-binding protein
MTYQTASSHIPPGHVSTVCRVAETGYSTALHKHEEYMFLVPRRGVLVLSSEANDLPVKIAPATLAVVRPSLLHETGSHCAENEHIAVYVESDFVSYCERKANRTLSVNKIAVCSVNRALLSAILLQSQLADHEPDDFSRYRQDLVDRLVATACVEAGLSPALRAGPVDRHKHLIDDIKLFLNATLTEQLDLDRIAEEFSLSRRHLTRIFRESTGESIGDYQTRQRVVRAAELLSVSGTTVLAASMAVGVESPSYLARLFIKHGQPLPKSFKP